MRAHRPAGFPATALCGALLAFSAMAGVWRMLPLQTRPGRPHPFRYACWYWHRPFHLSSAEQRELQEAQISRLYVYAGTIVVNDGRLELAQPQQWQSAAPGPIVAVIRVHPEANHALLTPDGVRQAGALLGCLRAVTGLQGVQWDADIPTERLRDYVQFLRQVRRMTPGMALGVTALPDWLRSPDYPLLCDAVDEIAPQFYGNLWPQAGKRPPPLWETAALIDQIGRSARGRARVWVGLPAYGRCLVIDPAGQPLGLRHDLDPEQLLDDPAWEVDAQNTRAEPHLPAAAVEDTLALRCQEDTSAGTMAAPVGTQLWFQWPRVEGLQSAIRQIQAHTPPDVEGVCFFRWRVPGEPLALPPGALAAAVRGDSRPGSESEGLEISLTRAGPITRVAVRNRALDSPPLDEGITVELFPSPGAEVMADEPISWRRGAEPASVRRADRAVFSRPLLRPGHVWQVCRVESGRSIPRVILRWKEPDGRSCMRIAPESGR